MPTATLSPPSLTTLMNRAGTDKLWAHHYDVEYERHFAPLRDKPIRLLEIGVGGYSIPNKGGESLRVWRDYFPQGEIIGLDIEDKYALSSDRITIWQGSQDSAELLLELNEKSGPFDIIIDDGSHIQSHVLTSFTTLFPCLASGGLYCIEDLATAYQPSYGGKIDPFSGGDTSISLLGTLIDGLHWRHWKDAGVSDIQRSVKSVHVSQELAVIYKR